MKLRDAGEERSQVAAHGEPRAEAGDDPAYQGLRHSDRVLRQAELDVVCPKGRAEGADKHAEYHCPVNTIERRALKMNELEVTPFLMVVPEPLQYFAAPAGEFPGYTQNLIR
jgi:hypothetical protein